MLRRIPLMAAAAIAAIFLLVTTASSRPPKDGRFIVRCGPSHFAQVDPIVAPGPKGTLSGHLHQFFGNRSTDSDSTYESMVAAGTTCELSGDTAGYWSPALIGPDGSVVSATGISAYYTTIPTSYSTTVPYPPDFRVIAGGTAEYPAHAFWSCKTEGVKYSAPPVCDASTFPRAIVEFPNCWDGVSLDSVDHRSHVVYPSSGVCPSTHPQKLPHLKLYVLYPQSIGGSGYVFSDGTTIAHADFWNTWSQPELERLVRDCLNALVMCGAQRG
jgi:hypothetical protein